jgi:DUF1680 family protein
MKKERMKAIPLRNINITDSYWSRHTSLVESSILPYQWNAINDRLEDAEPSHSLENFRIAAGEKEGAFYGVAFQDTDVAKWLESVGFSLASHPDQELEKTADEVIDLIGKAQCDDGYINTYFTIKAPELRWKNLTEGHELYTAGHLIEAAVAYYEGTGKRKFLDIVIRFADLICEVFGKEENRINGYPGHQEIELALIKLYYATKNRRYLEKAKYFIDARGVGENYFLMEMKRQDYKHIFSEFEEYLPLYSQSHAPVREQKTAEGHAVRATYMYSAMAELAYEYQDEELFEACKTIWNNIVKKRMYITGGIGSSWILERFTTDYDLPNDNNYAESCASVGMAMFGLRMAHITRDAKYMDVVEKELYNNILAGIALDGKSFFYVNPLEIWPDNCLERTSMEYVKIIRQKWFGVACCPPNIARTLASLGQYIYAVSEDTLCVNLFISNQTEVKMSGRTYSVRLKSNMPRQGGYSFVIRGDSDPKLKILHRIPGYAVNYSIYCEGKKIPYPAERGYAIMDGEICNKQIEVKWEMPAVLIRANPNVRADVGKVCIMKGPVVFALEEADNGRNLASIYLDSREPLSEVYEEELMGGCLTVLAKGRRILDSNWDDNTLYQARGVIAEDVTIRAIPYAFWNNRGIGEMLVWIKEALRL